MNSDIWASTETFHQAFWQGIERQMAGETAGALILATANASVDAPAFKRLGAQLRAGLAEQITHVVNALRAGCEPDIAPDDLAVLLRLNAVGLNWLQASSSRLVDSWELHHHPLRAFRPRRMASAGFGGLQQAFDTSRFHFNKPFLAPEILWEGLVQGRHASVLYNKFPFVPYHGIVVPERSAQRPQYLDESSHHWAAAFAADTAQALPGFGLAYNSNGAMASINHLHLQSFVRIDAFSIEKARWQHNGGKQAYALAVMRFHSAEGAWEWIAHRNANNRPYNLLFRGGTIWGIARRPQQPESVPRWSPGLAWSEVCGCFATSDQRAFQTLQATDLQAALAGLHE